MKEFEQVPSIQKAMVVVAHMDDESLWSEKLLWYQNHNIDLVVVSATHGELGIQEHMKGTTPEQMAQIRADEFKNAMTHLGVKSYILRGFEDSKLPRDQWALNQAILAIVQRENPDSVDSFFEYEISDYYDHLDHNAVGQTVRYASQMAASGKNKLERRPQLSLWTTNIFFANTYLRVSEKTREWRNNYLAQFYPSQFPKESMDQWSQYFDSILYKKDYSGPVELYRWVPRQLQNGEN